MHDYRPAAAFEGDAPTAASPAVMIDRRELALVAVERTRMPMVITDPRQPDNPVVLANGAFLELTGYTAEEVVGRNCSFLQGPGTDADAVRRMTSELKEGGKDISVELLNYRKDGSAFWNQLAISPVHDEHGALIYYFGSQRDITDQRRAEALEKTERLLLKEVDHRAMNALALVQSIVRLTRADSIERFSDRVRARIDALARAHQLLANSGWAQADIGDVIRMEVPEEVRPHVTAEGPTTLLAPQHVQPLTLVFHELMANAREHGALAAPRGELRIGWAVDGGMVVLNWQERGGREPAATPDPGLGMAMIQGLVERQLGGSSHMGWCREGLEAELRVPVAGARVRRAH